MTKFQNMYSNMDFPSYEYREYPKVVGKDPATKRDITVNNFQEEQEYLAGKKPKQVEEAVSEPKDNNPKGFGKNAGTEKQVKKELLEAATALGIKAKGTWGIKKLQDAINNYDNA